MIQLPAELLCIPEGRLDGKKEHRLVRRSFHLQKCREMQNMLQGFSFPIFSLADDKKHIGCYFPAPNTDLVCIYHIPMYQTQ